MPQAKYNASQLSNKIHDVMPRLLWRQWCDLGVKGHGGESGGIVIDPEALIVATCIWGRYEMRLFEEMLDWLIEFHPAININRLKAFHARQSAETQSILSAVADFTGNTTGNRQWKNFEDESSKVQIEPRALFMRDKHTPVPPFGSNFDEVFKAHGWITGKFEPRGLAGKYIDGISALRLKMRYLFGCNARAETIAFLLTNPDGAHPPFIGKQIGYTQKTVNDALSAMARSNYICPETSGNKRIYYLSSDFAAFLSGQRKSSGIWFNWMPACCFLELLENKLNDSGFTELSEQAQAVELRLMLKKLPYPPALCISRDGFSRRLATDGDITQSMFAWAEELLEFMQQ